MDGGPDGVPHGRGRGRLGRWRRVPPDRGSLDQVRRGPGPQHPDRRGGDHRRRRRLGHRRDAAGARDHVHRLHRRLLRPARQPRRQAALHVGRPHAGADDDAGHRWSAARPSARSTASRSRPSSCTRPGLKVAYPSTPYDAKGLLLACIEDEDPCVFVECTSLMMKRGPVPTEPYTIPLGKAGHPQASGDDVTIVSYGRLMYDVLKAADELAEGGHVGRGDRPAHAGPARHGRPCSPRWPRPAGPWSCTRPSAPAAPAAEIATRIHEELHGQLHGPVRRLTAPDSSVPAAPGLVGVVLPERGRHRGCLHRR